MRSFWYAAIVYVGVAVIVLIVGSPLANPAEHSHDHGITWHSHF